MSDALTPAAVAGVQAAVALGAAVVLPLGLRLVDDARAARVPAPCSSAWPLAGVAAALALLLPRGAVAVALAVPFAVAGAVLLVVAARGAVAALRSRSADPTAWAVPVALGTTAVGALALVGDRAGVPVLGFEGDLLLLTVPHMLFAGFAACLVAGLSARVAAVAGLGARLAQVGAWTVPGGVLAVLVGYFASDAAELVGTVVLTAGLWCATAAAWLCARRTPGRAGAAWAALALAGSVVAMLLALWWAAGEVTDVPHPDLSWMVATHGAVNALAVVPASLVAVRLRARAVPGSPFALRPVPGRGEDAVMAHGAHRARSRAGAAHAGPAGDGARAGVPRPGDALPADLAAGLTYAPVGVTRTRATGAAWRRAGVDERYRVLVARHRVLRRAREEDRAALARDVRTWRLHRTAGVRVEADGPAAPGARVVSLLGAGPLVLRGPCRVLWADDEGFGYGSLPGHPVAGEEAFRVTRDDAGDVWLEVEAYSRPASTLTRVAGPLVPVAQRLYVANLARAARLLHARRARPGGAEGGSATMTG